MLGGGIEEGEARAEDTVRDAMVISPGNFIGRKAREEVQVGGWLKMPMVEPRVV